MTAFDAVVLLFQSTNFQCVNSPIFVLHNSASVARNFAVQRLANCHIDSLYFDKVKPPRANVLPNYERRYPFCRKVCRVQPTHQSGWFVHYCTAEKLSRFIQGCPVSYDEKTIRIHMFFIKLT